MTPDEARGPDRMPTTKTGKAMLAALGRRSWSLLAYRMNIVAIEDEARVAAYDSVLRGLRSEDDTPQLRAIIASVEADRDR